MSSPLQMIQIFVWLMDLDIETILLYFSARLIKAMCEWSLHDASMK